jgi:hypothetical protein
MVAKLQLWRRQQIKKHWVAIGVIGIGLVVIIVSIIVGYRLDWTGFNGYNKVTTAHIISGANAGTITQTEEYQPGKGLWDWLNLLGVFAIPAVVALGAAWYTAQQGKVSARENTDNQRETALQQYFDKMSDLLLEKHLRESSREDEARTIARVRTLTILFQLDARRIGYVFAFLHESGLMSHSPNEESIVSFKEANLEKINFSQANLRRANLSGANLSQANLEGANLRAAILTLANLEGADLSGAYFYETDLWGANLKGANLSRAILLADLNNARLTGADLTGAYLQGANFSEADLSGANLRNATGITIEELKKQVKSLQGATLPDGSIHP